jgi:uncharacterized membrane protein (UPF0127 family)
MNLQHSTAMDGAERPTNSIGHVFSYLRNILVKRLEPEPDVRLTVTNTTRNTVLATQLELAGTPEKRNKGLLGRKGLAPGSGLWIVPCESVHTFFMQFPIDLVYLDRDNRVKKVRHAVGPWKLSACLSAHSILELPAGVIRSTGTQRGDTLELVPDSTPAGDSTSQ